MEEKTKMCKCYTIGIMFLLRVIFVNAERLSGLYVDNGFDQTVAHSLVNNDEKRRMEYELLNIFELPDRPKRITRKALLVKRSAPKFLLNIYENVIYIDKRSVGNMYGDTGEFVFSGQDIDIIDRSDMIMTFGAHNPHSGKEANHNRGKRIWFDVSEVPSGEHIIAAELRLYQSTNFKKHEPDKIYTIAVYRVARTNSGGRIKHYIDSVNTTVNQEGWITLNVSQALAHWVKYPKENRGLFLAVHHVDYTGHIMRPDDIGIVGVLGFPDKQPFMVGFFKNSGTQKTKSRHKRSIRRTEIKSNSVNIRTKPYGDPVVRRRAKACNIQSLYVNFKDLQWQDWIIAPEGYDAFYCSGECNFPLNIHMNATNHAIVQTLVHLLKPDVVPKPCCVPTKLSPISVLYFLDDSNVVLKKYKNMVVTSCGCH